MKETNGRGVDLVLNSLAEEKLQASVRCLAKGGRFLEIGKFDLAKNNMLGESELKMFLTFYVKNIKLIFFILGMEHFLKEISFHGVMLDNLFWAEPKWKQELKVTLDKGIRDGAVKPLIRTVFNADELEVAFRYDSMFTRSRLNESK